MKIQADLSVCTTVFKTTHSLKKLLTSLYQTAGPVSLEVIAVDMSGLVSPALGKEFPNLIVYEDSHETNQVKAINRGLDLATGRYVSIWDNDILVKPACLQTLLDFLDNNPTVGLAGPRVTDAYGKTEPSWQKFPSLLSILATLPPINRLGLQDLSKPPALSSHNFHASFEVERLQSGLQIIRREVFEELGFFDASFSWTYAEMEYHLRAQKAGWHTFFCPGAEIVHQNPARYHSELQTPAPFTQVARNSLKFLQKKWFAGKNPFQDAHF